MKRPTRVAALCLAFSASMGCAQGPTVSNQLSQRPTIGPQPGEASQAPAVVAPVARIPMRANPAAAVPPAAPPAPLPSPPPGTDPSATVRQLIIADIPRYNESIRRCYDNAAEPPDAPRSGQIILKLLIAPSGDVTSAEDAGSTMRLPSVISCLASLFPTMKFSRFDGKAVSIIYPMEFPTTVGRP